MQAIAAKTLSLLLLVFLGVISPLKAAEVSGINGGSNLALASAAGLPRKLAGIQAGIYSTIPGYGKLPRPPVPQVLPTPSAYKHGAYKPVTTQGLGANTPPTAAGGPAPIAGPGPVGFPPTEADFGDGPLVSPTQTSMLMGIVDMALAGYNPGGMMELAKVSQSEKCRRYCQKDGKARSWLKVELGAQWCYCDVA